MIREIYIRSTDDQNYRGPRVVDFEDDIEAIITQIKVLFGTSKGQILGSYNFGVGLEDLVFETNYTGADLEDKINEQIGLYIAPSFPKHDINAKVQFGHHEDGYDYALIDIFIDELNVVGIQVV